MAWKTTRDAPPCEWKWQNGGGLAIAKPDAESIQKIISVITEHGDVRFKNMTLLDYGCGRGACLNLASKSGFENIIGVDTSNHAIEATKKNLPNAAVVKNEFGKKVPLDNDCADLVWSHGVVEHMEGDELELYFDECARLSRKYVAISAPNPECKLYATVKRSMLDRQIWKWGFEEPLPSYAPMLVNRRMTILFDGHVCTGMHAADVYGRWLPRGRDFREIRRNMKLGHDQGLSTVVVAHV